MASIEKQKDGPASMETDSSSEGSLGLKIDSTMQLQKTKNWVEMQKVQHEAALRTVIDKERIESATDISELANRITELQHELQEASTTAAVDDTIVRRLQFGDLLQKILFPAADGSDDERQTDQSLLDLIQEQMNLSSEILKINKEIKELRPKLDELQKQNLDKKNANRQLMFEIKQKQQQEKERQEQVESTEELHSMKKKLSDMKAKLTMEQHIFQGLIIGSGVNWAEDPAMEKLVVSLGTSIDENDQLNANV